MEEESMLIDSIEKYYEYIIEQLEFVEMITSTFEIKKNSLSSKTALRCNELAEKIKDNLENL